MIVLSLVVLALVIGGGVAVAVAFRMVQRSTSQVVRSTAQLREELDPELQRLRDEVERCRANRLRIEHRVRTARGGRPRRR